jgi:hypothetical protein
MDVLGCQGVDDDNVLSIVAILHPIGPAYELFFTGNKYFTVI